MKLIIEPVHEFKKLIADISFSLIELANIYTSPGVTSIESQHAASDTLRKLASRLNSQIYLIPWYDKASKIFKLPVQKNINKASKHLIGLSNGVFESAANMGTQNGQKADNIRELLNIYMPDDEEQA